MGTPSGPRRAHGSATRTTIAFGLLAILWSGAIFWVSSGPVPAVVGDPLLDLLLKKTGHFCAYGLLASLWWLAVRGRLSPRVALVAAMAIAVCYAGSDEIHQAFTPTRDPSVIDVGIDTLGAATGLWVIGQVVRRWGSGGA
jgi:VanZ family protein